jgi:hypothetical protein
MKCKKAGILLSSYIDDDLGKTQVQRLESHLAKCNKCRKMLESLENYKRIAGMQEPRKAPEELAENIFAALPESDGSKANKKQEHRNTNKTLFWAAAAVAAALIIITIIPFESLKPEIVRLDFYNEVKKGGKGPAGGETFNRGKKGKGIGDNPGAKMVNDLVYSFGGEVVDTISESATGILGRLKIEIPRDEYDAFREAYNQLQPGNQIPEHKIRKGSRIIILSIGFPERRFLAGDYNGDGRDDILILVSGMGKKPGWYISINKGEGDFKAPSGIHFPERYIEGITARNVIAGDFNGNGFCDIALVSIREANPSIMIFSNMDGEGYKTPVSASFDKTPDLSGGRLDILCGDIDGNNLDDIVLYHQDGNREGTWHWSGNTGNNQFKPFEQLEVPLESRGNASKYTLLITDINGDGLSEPCIYGQGGEKDAFWFISVNEGNMRFRQPDKLIFGNSQRAFQGDYTVFFGDLDGDNLDDLLVKYGSSTDFSYWFKLINNSGGKFSLGYPVDISGMKDFSLNASMK